MPQNSISENQIFEKFPWGHAPTPPSFRIVLHTMTLSKSLIFIVHTLLLSYHSPPKFSQQEYLQFEHCIKECVKFMKEFTCTCHFVMSYKSYSDGRLDRVMCDDWVTLWLHCNTVRMTGGHIHSMISMLSC